MPLGKTYFVHKPEDYHGEQQKFGIFVGHTTDAEHNKFIDKVWNHMKELGISFETCWAPLMVKPYTPLSPEAKAKRRKTKYINRIKKQYPLFAKEIIQERYPEYEEN